jgi:hypothetical protein
MKIAMISILALTGLLGLCGCGDSVDNTPPRSAITPHPGPPPKIPTTVDEKIKAINGSSMPEAQKKQEIEKVKAGSL